MLDLFLMQSTCYYKYKQLFVLFNKLEVEVRGSQPRQPGRRWEARGRVGHGLAEARRKRPPTRTSARFDALVALHAIYTLLSTMLARISYDSSGWK